jgi:hypothetical protein
MNKINISLFLFLIIFSQSILCTDKARGFFMSAGVGPRFPVSSFSTTSKLGYGLNLEFSYTDNEVIPFFLFTKVGYEQYPGSQDFYKASDYANLSTTLVPMNAGMRYYFPPFLESLFLLLPVVEASALVTYTKELHQFKSSSGKNDFANEKYKFGFSAGAGVSMFLMELMASYNFLKDNQFISADLKIRLPITVIF